MKDPIWNVITVLPTDYSDYGGKVIRWKNEHDSYPDCSCDCRHYRRIMHDNEIDTDWGVCWNELSPRFGLLTWEHQAGYKCYETQDLSSWHV